MLLAEVLAGLEPQPGQTIVDGTAGGGGHARALADRVTPTGQVLALDRDPAAIAALLASELPANLKPVVGSYVDLPEILAAEGLTAVDAILLDLGLSSDQLADPQRGFSFQTGGPLDMRFDPTQGEPAWRLLSRLSEKTLADLIYAYGEERHSRRIARRIVESRRRDPIDTSEKLATLVRAAVPRGREKIDPATRTFQALRIAVNDELRGLDIALRRLPDCLRPGGRLAIISFHSLEDRRVKEAFRNDPRLEVITKRPDRATDEEATANPRARSARLRVARRRTAV
ncbi:MAG: 16S rRNA (cytosine(1402)-N(4))-methyltransferase RsmH [Pirellulales bacterium]|nr:16S rRNA (cytosine(1402)-N(4))-methyltransferase RsmH [Pirellulales bacterium]